MSDLPLISIALCTYNGERFLKEQLDSILGQTYANIEIIVVDDNSTDSTCSILESYREKSKLKYFINENNIGLCKNFEKALSLCSGEYIALADQDDIWESNKLELLIKKISANCLIYADSVKFPSVYTPAEKMSDSFNFINGSNIKNILIQNCASGHNILFHRSLIEKAIPFPDNFFHDWWIIFCAAATGSISYTNDVLVKYRQHENNFTNPINKEKIFNIERILDALEKFQTFPYLRPEDQDFILNLISTIKKSKNQVFSFSLFWVLFKNSKEMLYVYKKNSFDTRLNFAFKEAFGLDLKKAFHNLRSKSGI